jgi:hypothetical protein
MTILDPANRLANSEAAHGIPRKEQALGHSLLSGGAAEHNGLSLVRTRADRSIAPGVALAWWHPLPRRSSRYCITPLTVAPMRATFPAWLRRVGRLQNRLSAISPRERPCKR